MKFCECGCGQPTNQITKSRPERGYTKGTFARFVHGHYDRASANPSTRSYPHEGWSQRTGHQYVKQNGEGVAIHRLIAERILGRPLPKAARVHHRDGNPTNNQCSNLVICQDNIYHLLLHQRLRALQACGYAHWRKCVFCKEYDDPIYLVCRPTVASFHPICRASYRRQYGK